MFIYEAVYIQKLQKILHELQFQLAERVHLFSDPSKGILILWITKKNLFRFGLLKFHILSVQLHPLRCSFCLFAASLLSLLLNFLLRHVNFLVSSLLSPSSLTFLLLFVFIFVLPHDSSVFIPLFRLLLYSPGSGNLTCA